METIAHAAILNCKIRCLIFGRDHDECVMRSIKIFGFIYDYPMTGKGFLTNNMRFVSRWEAMGIAIAAGQVNESIKGKVLISEHFINKDLGGKHYYDSILGYIILSCPEDFKKNKK